MKTFHITVTGKVQGVWFRASAKDKALSLGLKGKVWNDHDETVGIIAQGDLHRINEFIEWCKHGPPLAKVDQVNVEEVTDEYVFNEFEISRSR
ncbi:MAG: acylphosphatase [Saprospiraceae bacterium]